VTLLVLSGADVRELLSYAECATVMRSALAGLARGDIQQPLRSAARPAGAAGFQVMMPSYSGQAGYGLKALCITPGNPSRGLDAHQGGVLLFAAGTGEPVALVNASALTEIRTAAVSAVATDLLAIPGASVVAIIGTGVQGAAHVRALAATRPLSEVRMYGRSASRTESVAAGLAGELGVPVTAARSAEEAVTGAGIVVTATSSATPVIARDWLAPGTHLNAVGACVPSDREIDTATMAAAALFADSRESLEHEAGDYLLAVKDLAVTGTAEVGPARATLGQILAGTGAGRRDDAEITVFESLGLAAEDLMAASFVYQKAARLGAGTVADFLPVAVFQPAAMNCRSAERCMSHDRHR
jgi:ornithine cyclodeaminase/alanine dehydrogenase-like protein (mu-crystallin family)